MRTLQLEWFLYFYYLYHILLDGRYVKTKGTYNPGGEANIDINLDHETNIVLNIFEFNYVIKNNMISLLSAESNT